MVVVGVVVAPSWWWGVVFDLWIVVASIKMRDDFFMSCLYVMQIFLILACIPLGVCVGDDSFFGFVL